MRVRLLLSLRPRVFEQGVRACNALAPPAASSGEASGRDAGGVGERGAGVSDALHVQVSGRGVPRAINTPALLLPAAAQATAPDVTNESVAQPARCASTYPRSETDVLVPPEDVRAFADSRARADKRVVLRPFADAPHVELLRRWVPLAAWVSSTAKRAK